MSSISPYVLGSLSVAAIIALIKSRWLYIIVPKMYLNTSISDGQIVTVEIFNAGLLAEENVTLNMRPTCKFDILATSKSTITQTAGLSD